jgi:XTP/dITP diphosphohydrolase
MKLLVATRNPGKLREFQQLLDQPGLELVTLDQVGIQDDVEESGETIAENARLKALAYARQSGMLVLADDSGLEVDALGGEPGVYSKRYAGGGKTDADRNAFLLDTLSAVPPGGRTARFRCVIVIADASGRTWESEGTCEGVIAFEARGTNGFGYDPIFVVGERGKHLAELSDDDKNRVSHRGRAAQGAREILARIAEAREGSGPRPGFHC